MRSRKLSFPKLMTFVLSLTASGKTQGVDGKSGGMLSTGTSQWFMARGTPGADAIHRSAVTKARKKLSWTIFDALLKDAVQLAYDIGPNSSEYTWQGMTAVFFK